MKKSIGESIVEAIVGFDRWAKAWGQWHKGTAGRPDCEYCRGSGVVYVYDGHDDVDGDICECVKEIKQ